MDDDVRLSTYHAPIDVGRIWRALRFFKEMTWTGGSAMSSTGTSQETTGRTSSGTSTSERPTRPGKETAAQRTMYQAKAIAERIAKRLVNQVEEEVKDVVAEAITDFQYKLTDDLEPIVEEEIAMATRAAESEACCLASLSDVGDGKLKCSTHGRSIRP